MHWSYYYDKSGRLTEIGHRMDNNQEFSMQKNKYNEIGQLIERNFHSEDRVHWWQSVDYKYNILGWLTNINQANLTNSNTIIDFNQALDPDETVDGLIYDTVFLLITEKQYEGNLNKYLNLAYQDRKKLLVSDIDTPSQTRFIQINETKSKILDKKATDTLTYNILAQLHDIPFSFNLNGLEFDAFGSQAFVLDSLQNEILNKLLTQYQITDTNLREYFLKEVVDFIGSSIGIIYVNDDRDDIFGENIYYNYDNSPYNISALQGTSRFNGNISNILWQTTGSPGIRGYGFQYDRANRYTQAKYAELDEDNQWTVNAGRYDEFGIDYDENGNIAHLVRNGLTGRNGGVNTYGTMDQLTYSYSGNQLKAVQDNIANTGTDNNDFKDNGSYANEEYIYDNNGSLISDDNKGIESITYNYLNLPVEIVFTGDHKVNYLYDASGRKLRMTITYADHTVETFNYSGGVIYHDQDLESIEFGVGRVVKKPDHHFYYQYYMTDHLGNIRQVYEYNESTHEVEVVQENHFYPFGLTMGGLNIYSGIENTKLYQGKELEDKSRLNWYDFHARRFDSQLGRWHAIDPVIQFASPYVGMGNIPVVSVDPDGSYICISCFFDMVGAALFGGWYSKKSSPDDAGTLQSFNGFFPSIFGGTTPLSNFNISYSSGARYTSGYNNSNSLVQGSSYGSGSGNGNYGVVHSTPENPHINGWGGGLGSYGYVHQGPSVGEQIMQLDGNIRNVYYPTIYVSFIHGPYGVDHNEFMNMLRERLIYNGVTENLVVTESSTWNAITRLFSGEPYATLYITLWSQFDYWDDIGGAAVPGSHKAKVYDGLTSMGEIAVLPSWKYVNVAMHELGHAIWSFQGDVYGGCLTCIMDYDGAYNYNSNFTDSEIKIIINSIWGQ